MALYFSGRKLLKTFSTYAPDERNRIDWRVYEEWRDIDEGTTSRCGIEGTCTVEVAKGISEKSMSIRKEVAGVTLGLKDVWALKYDVEQSIGREINWEVTEKSTKSFRIQPPKCGRSALTVYQLFRVYEFTFLRKKWLTFSEDKWVRLPTRRIEERTNNHDAMPDTIESDPACKCPQPQPEPTFDGFMHLSFGTIGMRVPYRETQAGFELQIDRHVIHFGSDDLPTLMRSLEDGIDIAVDAALVPEPLRFLGQVEEATQLLGRMVKWVDEVEAAVPEFADPVVSIAISTETWVAEDPTPGQALTPDA